VKKKKKIKIRDPIIPFWEELDKNGKRVRKTDILSKTQGLYKDRFKPKLGMG